MKAGEQFWKWLIRHEADLFGLSFQRKDEREGVFDEIAARLQRVDPDVTFAFGPNAPRREFVIGAGGIKRAFSSVASLVGSAP